MCDSISLPATAGIVTDVAEADPTCRLLVAVEEKSASVNKRSAAVPDNTFYISTTNGLMCHTTVKSTEYDKWCHINVFIRERIPAVELIPRPTLPNKFQCWVSHFDVATEESAADAINVRSDEATP